MNYTQSIGNLNELKCISRFIELGYECSIPYGNGAKYDFIVDVNGELLKIQCKSCSHPRRNGTVDNDAIQISTVSQTTNTKKTTKHTYSNQEIDYFATSYNDKIYVVPVDECSTNKTLRFKAPLNNSQYNMFVLIEFALLYILLVFISLSLLNVEKKHKKELAKVVNDFNEYKNKIETVTDKTAGTEKTYNHVIHGAALDEEILKAKFVFGSAT